MNTSWEHTRVGELLASGLSRQRCSRLDRHGWRGRLVQQPLGMGVDIKALAPDISYQCDPEPFGCLDGQRRR